MHCEIIKYYTQMINNMVQYLLHNIINRLRVNLQGMFQKSLLN
jgi:hypothetical protein